MKRRIYVDGIFDLFHKGHVMHFKDMKELDNEDNYLIVGIISDKDAKDYKRLPIYNQENRKILVESCRYVDEIIENAVGMMDGNFDHPYAWNNFPEKLLQEAKDLWKVN